MKPVEVLKPVKEILTAYPETRSCDNQLIIRVWQSYGMDMSISAAEILENYKQYGLPSLESIRRARQKVQAKHPELKPDPRVTAIREELQDGYIELAKAAG